MAIWLLHSSNPRFQMEQSRTPAVTPTQGAVHDAESARQQLEAILLMMRLGTAIRGHKSHSGQDSDGGRPPKSLSLPARGPGKIMIRATVPRLGSTLAIAMATTVRCWPRL